jgi:ATP-binding cassette subfamily B protein
MLETVAVLSLPWLGGKFAGGILSGSQPRLPIIVIALLGALALQAALRFATGFISSLTANRLLADLRIRIHDDHLLTLPIDFY